MLVMCCKIVVGHRKHEICTNMMDYLTQIQISIFKIEDSSSGDIKILSARLSESVDTALTYLENTCHFGHDS